MNKSKNEFKMFQTTEYETHGKSLGPDGRIHYLVYNNKNDRYAYVFNKKYLDDASFYSPYLLHRIGKKIGIDVPETELGIYLEKDIDTRIHLSSFYESSLVYLNGISGLTRYSGNISFADSEVVQAIFLSEDTDSAKNIRGKCAGRALPITIDEYIMSNIHFLTTRGKKAKQEFTKKEIDEMKQELIDRIMFGLKFGIKGKNSIIMYENSDAILDSYYLSSPNMFSLNVRTEWVKDVLEKDDKDFKTIIDKEYPSQYGIPPNMYVPDTKQVLDYLYTKYPKQTKNAHNKISRYTRQDLEKELDNFSQLDLCRKEFALRVFDVREKEFNEAYINYNKKLEEESR